MYRKATSNFGAPLINFFFLPEEKFGGRRVGLHWKGGRHPPPPGPPAYAQPDSLQTRPYLITTATACNCWFGRERGLGCVALWCSARRTRHVELKRGGGSNSPPPPPPRPGFHRGNK